MIYLQVFIILCLVAAVVALGFAIYYSVQTHRILRSMR